MAKRKEENELPKEDSRALCEPCSGSGHGESGDGLTSCKSCNGSGREGEL